MNNGATECYSRNIFFLGGEGVIKKNVALSIGSNAFENNFLGGSSAEHKVRQCSESCRYLKM